MNDRDPGNVRMADYPQLKGEVERIFMLMGRDHLDFLNVSLGANLFRCLAWRFVDFDSNLC